FAASTTENDFALDALVHAGALAYTKLFDLDRASKDYESVLNRARGGLSEPAEKAAFGLVDIAYASENFPLARTRIAAIQSMLEQHRTSNEKNIEGHLLYEQGLGLYYQGEFDSSVVLLDSVAADASSDYANDAISLVSLIQESNTTFGRPSLTHFAAGALAEQAHRYAQAEANYRAITDSEFNAPLADEATLHSAAVLVELGRPADAVSQLDSMQIKLLASPLLDDAAFRAAEITERDLHDNVHAQKMYEDFLERYPNSIFVNDARDRARKLRGDAF
ncbi:MAG: tol-pal system YbgF family protein, partial [Candidatus Kapaibacterium sp.]